MSGPYKIGTLARLTGVPPVLLRAWERRFDLLDPRRGPGGQRLYSDQDLALLRQVKALVDGGRPIGEVARLGREALLAGGGAVAAPTGEALSGAEAWRDRLVTAALALDARALSAALDSLFLVVAADRAVHDVIEPVTREIGDLWAAGRCSIASEHLASSHFLHRMGRLLDAAQPPDPDAPRVIAACLPGEQQPRGLIILAWHLAKHGVRVVYLGAELPLGDLEKACRASAPGALLLSVTRPSVFRDHRRTIARLAAKGACGHVFVGGQGVPAGATLNSPRGELLPRQSAGDIVPHIASVVRAARRGGGAIAAEARP
jgi:DNA-binding transcriptional MerR regulator